MIDITIKNYRCFPRSHPARITLRPGLTAFVGVNNSGKSSLLRFFYELRSLFEVFGTSSLLGALQGARQGFGGFRGVVDGTECFPRANGADSEISFAFDTAVSGEIQPVVLTLFLHREGVSWTAKIEAGGSQIACAGAGIVAPGVLNAGSVIVDLAPLFATVQQLVNSCYLPAFRNAINTGTKPDYYDISVGQSFVQAFREWKTGNSIARNEATGRLIRDIQELFAFDQFDINPSPDDTTLQLFINNRSFRLHELGSGLAQFILVFGNVAVKEPAFILIDEPELSLHPSLQLKFLSSLAHYASVGVLFATHSYGLSRSSADQIYMLRKIKEDESVVSRVEDTSDLPHVLQDLTYSGFRDLGFEKILLVEGPTDLPVFRHFLRLLRKDHKIVLFPLGGDGMINGKRINELDELKRVSSNIAAVIDSERPSANAALATNRAEFYAACRNANVPCHVLERRAVENYFPEAAIKRIKGPKYRALGPFERFSDVPLEWSKDRDNCNVALEMSIDDLGVTDLREFLLSL
jgi:predicted ATPase